MSDVERTLEQALVDVDDAESALSSLESELGNIRSNIEDAINELPDGNEEHRILTAENEQLGTKLRKAQLREQELITANDGLEDTITQLKVTGANLETKWSNDVERLEAALYDIKQRADNGLRR